MIKRSLWLIAIVIAVVTLAKFRGLSEAEREALKQEAARQPEHGTEGHVKEKYTREDCERRENQLAILGRYADFKCWRWPSSDPERMLSLDDFVTPGRHP